MPLDPQALVSQIEAATPRLRTDFDDLKKYLDDAIDLYQKANAQEWRDLVETNRAGLALGYPYATLHENNPTVPAPANYTVVATDGSVIPPDRHGGTALYHVINTGRVALRYGAESNALIDSQTQFFAGDVTDDDEQYDAKIIDIKRDLYELKEGVELARAYAADLVLLDGPLTIWSSRTLTDDKSNDMRREYYKRLGELRDENIPVIGYISNTHSRSVTNSLRLLRHARLQNQPTLFEMDDRPTAPAKNRKPGSKRRENLGGLNGVKDAAIFERTLQPGSYSEIFKTAFSEPKELAEYIGAVCFVYWRTATEVVRLEFPEWLVENGGLAGAIGLVADQFRRGDGYPVALTEAHESAVLRGDDRELLRILLEERGLLQTESEKGRSKRLRTI
jgi:NurA domain